MKRTIAVYILLLANIFLMAHSFVPHHHHDSSEVCVLGFTCESCDNHEDHNHNCTHHADHHSDASGDCIVHNIYFRADDNKATVSLDSQDLKYPCLSAIFDAAIRFNLLDDGGLPFRQKPPVIPLYSDFVVCSGGLRAPPVLRS